MRRLYSLYIFAFTLTLFCFHRVAQDDFTFLKNQEQLLKDFPSNYIVGKWDPSCQNGDYIFYPDGKFILQHGCFEKNIKLIQVFEEKFIEK